MGPLHITLHMTTVGVFRKQRYSVIWKNTAGVTLKCSASLTM
jgi:hypothetical protein